MITPSHIIYSWALAKKTNGDLAPTVAKKRTLAFVLGALLPDTPTYIFFIVCGLILGYSGEVMWDDMYFNSGWSIPITLTHSFLLWPALITASTYFGWKFLRWFSISALFHTIVDFFVHTDDAYRHFYPLSNWKFHSPISYYNPAEYGIYVGLFDTVLVLFLLSYLYQIYRQKTTKWPLYIIVVAMIFYGIRLVAEPLIMYLHTYGS